MKWGMSWFGKVRIQKVNKNGNSKKNDVETEMNEDTISEYYIPSADKWKESMKKAHIKLTESIKKNPLILGNKKNK